MTTRTPTISDVAMLAGVGNATVSRVLNGHPKVTESTRKRVLAAVETLRFKPNAQAKLLAGGRKHNVMLVYPAMAEYPLTWYFPLLESGVIHGCGDHGLQLQTNFVFPDSLQRYERVLGPVEAGECDGVILAPPFSDDPDLIEKIRLLGMPLVLISSGLATRDLAAGIGLDDEAAGFELTNYLISLGHRRFGFINGRIDHKSAGERFEGFIRATELIGLTQSDIITVRGGLTFDTGEEAFKRIVATDFKPTAVLCANDEMAAGALNHAHHLGMRIPSEMTIVGFDDAPFAYLLSPPLTTISQPIYDMAKKSVDILVDCVKGRHRKYELTRPRLVIRQSNQAICELS